MRLCVGDCVQIREKNPKPVLSSSNSVTGRGAKNTGDRPLTLVGSLETPVRLGLVSISNGVSTAPQRSASQAFSVPLNHLGNLLKHTFPPIGLVQGFRFCISNRLPDAALAQGPQRFEDGSPRRHLVNL